MNAPDGTGSSQGRDPDEGVVLPSWIDAAIAKTRADEPPPEAGEPAYQDETTPPYVEAYVPRAARPEVTEVTSDPWDQPSEEEYEDAAEGGDLQDEVVYEQGAEADEITSGDEGPGDPYESPRPSLEPFPSFLERRTPRFSEIAPEPEPAPMPETPPMAASSRPLFDEFEEKRAAIVSEALREPVEPVEPVEALPASRLEPIPLPVAPARRRAPSGPWLMAAIFFAAAAIVLAVLIWLRPLQ